MSLHAALTKERSCHLEAGGTMEEYKIVRVQSSDRPNLQGVEPPNASDVEVEIHSKNSEGWEFVSISSGAVTYRRKTFAWTYIVFRRVKGNC
jgi:hypothetical protein